MVHKTLEDVVQSVLEQTYSPPLVLQDLYRFDVLMNVDSNEVAPDIGNHDDGKEIRHTRMVTDMGAFDIEAARFHTRTELSFWACRKLTPRVWGFRKNCMIRYRNA